MEIVGWIAIITFATATALTLGYWFGYRYGQLPAKPSGLQQDAGRAGLRRARETTIPTPSVLIAQPRARVRTRGPQY
jgi:hypothetical protein